ncbi:AsmA family protein [Lunatibacter salilacus]|uniref:AsmA-like C-terminal region-containing protein n=1 Tax=Lunatibacter salilacus TaxID=2483804 RepID=UPI00131C32E3|nr:AsmA-like C-terminal region-containing protein [Lunatibacter salilacus]
MTKKKKWVIASTLLLIPLFIMGGAVIAVYKNQRSLTQKAIEKVNEQFTGKLVVNDSYISPFAQFPYISIDLRGVQFFEDKDMQAPPIYEAGDVYLGFDLWDILQGDYQVKRVKIANGHLDLIKYENGDINLLLAKNIVADSTAQESEESLEFNLNELSLVNFNLFFEDHTMDQTLSANLDGLSAAIRLTAEDIFLDLTAKLILDLYRGDQPTFFSNKSIELDWVMDFHRLEQVLEVFPSKLLLEESLFTLEGSVDLRNDLYMDFKLYGEKPDFNIFAAFAPAEVAGTLKRYQNEGEIYFLGTIEGKAGNGNMPAIAVEFGCENAYFVNIDMEKRVDDLRFAGFFTNGKERSLQTSEFRLTNFYAKPEEGLFQGQLVVRNFEDPYIKVSLNADLDLQFLGQFFEVEGLQRITGQIRLDMDFDELIDMDMPTEGLSRLKEGIDSELTISNLSFTIPDFPLPITKANGHAVMEAGRITLDFLRFTVGESDFDFSASLSDFPSIFHKKNNDVTLTLSAKSDKIDVTQLLSYDSLLSKSFDEEITQFQLNLGLDANAREFTSFKYLPEGEFRIEDFYAKLKHYPHLFHDFDALITIEENNLSIQDFSGEIDGSDFHFSGLVRNYPKLFQDVKVGDSTIEFDFDSKLLKMKDLLSYKGENYLPDDYKEEELTEVELNGRLELHFDSVFQSADLTVENLQAKLKIHPLKLEDFKGRVHMEQGNILVEDFGGKMGQSDFAIDLAYFSGTDEALKSRGNYFGLRAKSLDLDALLNYNPQETSPVSHADTFNIFELPFSDMRFEASIGRLYYHTYWLENVHGGMKTTADHYLYVDTLHFNLAEGSLGLNGYFNGSDPSHIYFNSTMKAENLDIDKLMIKFDNFGQDVMVNENLHGKVSGTITSNFLVHPDLTPIIEKSDAVMDLTVTQGSLVNFTPLEAVASYFKDRNLRMVRFDTLQNTFDLKDGVLNIPKMNINSSLGYIELSGKQTLDLKMDYFLRIPLGLVTQVGFRSLFPGKEREEVDPEREDAIVFRDQNRRVRFVNLNISGDPDNFNVSLGRDKGQ